jgi:hypothetical protein
MKELLRRYQIIIFFALTFIIGWYPYITLSGMMSGEVVPTPDFGILWTQVVVAVFVALIFVIATKGRLGFVAKEQTKSERSASLITNP